MPKRSYLYPFFKLTQVIFSSIRCCKQLQKAVITVVIIQISMLSAAARVQTIDGIKIDLQLKDATLTESFRILENKSGIRLCFYQALVEKETKRITLNEKHIAVKEVLNTLLQNTQLRYWETPNCVVIEAKPAPPEPPGKLKGRIVEFETSQPLPGATVRIVERNQGMSASESGYYQFSLPPGTYTLEVSYIGYRTVTQRVQISTGKESTYDIKLQADNKLSEVVVQGRRGLSKAPVAFTSEQELLTEIRGARAIVSGISNEQITKTADRSAAEAVRRIAGITVTDNRFIEVRGMSQRYNLTYLNNNIAPSTELYNKAFAYDLLPTSIIDRMLVYKSPTAELFGDYAGGAVKIFTKDAQPVRHLEVGVLAAYREGTTFREMNAYKGGGMDWLGFDDGTRQLPAAFRNNLGNQTIAMLGNSRSAEAFSSQLQTGTRRAMPDMQLFANYFDNWKIGRTRLFSLTSVTFTNENRRLAVHNQTGNTERFMTDGNVNDGSFNRIAMVEQGINSGKLSALQNFTLRLSPQTSILFNNFFLNEGQSYAYDEISRLNTNSDVDKIAYTRDRTLTLGFQQRTVYSGNLGANHTFGKDSLYSSQLHFDIGYTYARQSIPDQRRIHMTGAFIPQDGYSSAHQAEKAGYRWRSAGSNLGSEDNLRLGMINRLFQQNDEKLYNLNAEYSFWIRKRLKLKAGTYHFFRDRLVNRRFFKVNRAGLTGTEVSFIESPDPRNDRFVSNNRELIEFGMQDLDEVWSARYFADDNSGLKIYDATSPIDRYVASEQNNAGYMMGDWQSPNKRFIVNAGFRLERNHIRLAGAIPVGPVAYGNFRAVIAEELKTTGLPSVNITFEPSRAWTFRTAYGRTVNRPEIREKAPFSDFDYQNNESIRGNINLRTAVIDNFDLRAEWYPQSGVRNEMISAGVFYKFLNDPIERVREQSSGFGGTTYPMVSFFNAEKAIVYGAEIEIRKNLSFIPGTFFRNLSFIGNGALIESKAYAVSADISISNGQSQFYIDPSLLSFNRRLQGQAAYVLNAGLYYENPGWGTKITVVHNVNGPRIYAASVINPELAENLQARREAGEGLGNAVNAYLSTRSNVVELPLHLLNVSFQQRLYDALQLRISIQNLLGQPNRLVEDNNSDYRYDKEVQAINPGQGGAPDRTYYTGDNIFRSFNMGRYYNLSFTYSF